MPSFLSIITIAFFLQAISSLTQSPLLGPTNKYVNICNQIFMQPPSHMIPHLTTIQLQLPSTAMVLLLILLMPRQIQIIAQGNVSTLSIILLLLIEKLQYKQMLTAKLQQESLYIYIQIQPIKLTQSLLESSFSNKASQDYTFNLIIQQSYQIIEAQ